MTPIEQDEELREAILLEFKNVHRLAPADYTENCTNIVMQLITADRKRVALEARLQEVEVSITELERSDDPRFYGKDEAIRSQRARYTHLEAELKAKQEEQKWQIYE